MSNIIDEDFLKKPEENNALEFATFWQRVWASVLDGALFLPLGLLGIYNFTNWKSMPLFLLLQLCTMLYKPLLEWKYGATFGKMAARIKVISVTGGAISLQQSFNRWILYFFSSFSSFLAGFFLFYKDDFYELTDFTKMAELLGTSGVPEIQQIASIAVSVSCLFVFFDLRRQSLHDKIAKTYVVKIS